MRATPWKSVTLALVAMLTAACGNDKDAESSPTASPTSETTATPGAVPLEGTLTVFAASSLTDAFGEIGEAFTTANPGVDVEFNFAASSALATQINERAPADVFASADGAQMQVVTEAGNGAGEPTIFATNVPVVIVPAGNTTVSNFEDLTTTGVALVLAAENVPIGRYAREILTKASGAGAISADFSEKVLANLQSDEANVRAVLTKVQLGEADAGIVYQTDATAGGNEVQAIEIPEKYNVVAQYPIGVLKESQNPDAAAAFVDFVLSDAGQEILADFGFGAAT